MYKRDKNKKTPKHLLTNAWMNIKDNKLLNKNTF